MTTVTPTQEEERTRLRRVSPLRAFFNRPEFGAIIGAILAYSFFVVVAGGRGFFGLAGTANFLEVAAQIGIVGVAVSLLMIAGEFDLSVGSMVGAAGMIVALGTGEFGLPIWLSILLAFAFALGVGLIHGLLVVRTGLPSFIVTLGSLFILRGVTIAVTRLLTKRTQVGGLDALTAGDPFAALFTTEFRLGDADFRISILWWLGLTVVATYVLLRTPFGNWIYGTGGSAVAARQIGVPVARVKISLFMATAASAALLAVIQVLTVGGADVLRGQNKELEAIITAVIGGTLLSGGYGSAVGTAFGALILGMVDLGIFFWGVDSDWYRAALGGLLFLFVLINNYVRRRASEGLR